MAKFGSLDRRSFIKKAGFSALAGAAGAAGTLATTSTASAQSSSQSRMANGRYDFDTVYNRVGSNCSRWDGPATRYPEGEFKFGMGVASMDYECAPCITEALEKRIQHHSWGYMASRDDLYEGIVNWNGEYHNIDLDRREITLSDAVYPGMIAGMRSFIPPGGKVLIMSPAYSGFYTMARAANVQTVDSKMTYNNGRWAPDWADLEAKMTSDVRALIVCNPHNPTGNVWTEDELLRMGRLALENDVVVLSDEIHSDVVRDGHRYRPFASLPDRAVVENSITCNAISKTFNLAGMKSAYYYSKSPKMLERVNQYHFADISTLGVVANVAAYKEGREWFEQANAYMDGLHDVVENFVTTRMESVGYTRNEGTFMTFLDFSKTMEAIDAKGQYEAHGARTPEHYFQDWLVHNSGVYLNPGSTYGTGGEGHMRMNIASARSVLEGALESLANAVNRV